MLFHTHCKLQDCGEDVLIAYEASGESKIQPNMGYEYQSVAHSKDHAPVSAP